MELQEAIKIAEERKVRTGLQYFVIPLKKIGYESVTEHWFKKRGNSNVKYVYKTQ